MRKKAVFPFIFLLLGLAVLFVGPHYFFNENTNSPSKKITSATDAPIKKIANEDYRQVKRIEGESGEEVWSDKGNKAFEAHESAYVSYADGLLSVNAADYPLSLILQEVNRLTGIVFHIDRNVERHIGSFDIRAQPLQQAIKSLLKDFAYTLLFDEGVFHAVGVYMPGTDYGDMAEFSSRVEEDLGHGYTVPESATELYSAFLEADQEHTETLMAEGLISYDQDVRALSLWTAIQTGVQLQRHQFESMAQRDSSPVVRALALQGLLGSHYISNDEKLSFALLMASDANENVRNAAEDYITYADQEPVSDSISQGLP